jgi:hypothetical protein
MSKKPALGLGASYPLPAFRLYSNGSALLPGLSLGDFGDGAA